MFMLWQGAAAVGQDFGFGTDNAPASLADDRPPPMPRPRPPDPIGIIIIQSDPLLDERQEKIALRMDAERATGVDNGEAVGEARHGIRIVLPRDLADVLHPPAEPVVHSALADGVEPCKAVDDVGGPETFDYSCPVSPNGEYSVHLVGFHPISLFGVTSEDRDGWAAYLLRNEHFDSTAEIVVVSARQEAGVGQLPAMALSKRWPDLSKDLGSIVDLYFQQIDQSATGMARLCNPTDESVSLDGMLADDVTIPVEVNCNFALLDRSGLPEEVAEARLTTCIDALGVGPFCVQEPDAASEDVELVLPEGSSWDTARRPLEPHMALADLLLFPLKPLLTGSAEVVLGELRARYYLKSAELFDTAGRTCGVEAAPADGQLALAGQPWSNFECRGLPASFALTLVKANDQPALFRDMVVATVPVAGLADYAPTATQAVADIGVQVVADDDRALPAYFSLKLYPDFDACRGRTAPALYAVDMGAGQRPELSLDMLAAGAFVVLNGEQPVTLCTELDLDALLADLDPEDPLVRLSASLIRPAGKFSTIVLMPTRGMQDDGWRNILLTVLEREVTRLAGEQRGVATDLYEVTENGIFRPIVAGEEYVSLPFSGGPQSLMGRIDALRWDATVSRPAANTNLIQANIGTDVDEIVLVVDSRKEEFAPRDLGTLYHWLIHTDINIRVISISKCDEWTGLPGRMARSIDCFDLEDLEGLPDREKADEVADQLAGVWR